MTDKELKRLSRAELLELLIYQTRESERLQAELDETRRALEDRRLRVREIGNLAQAALEVNGVMEAAQAAAQQYLDNIAAMEEETRRKCEQILRAAYVEAKKIREAADASAEF